MLLNIKGDLLVLFTEIIEKYGTVIALVVIGIFIGWYGKALFFDRRYNKQINIRFKDKDLQISQLNQIISERLSKVVVQEKDKEFFKKIKRFFNNAKNHKI